MTSSKEQIVVDKKKGYLWNELRSLGIEPKRNTELNDDDEELQQLADIIKLSMYQDYKMAFSMNGEKLEEAQSTIN
jgi:hypothetical protein